MKKNQDLLLMFLFILIYYIIIQRAYLSVPILIHLPIQPFIKWLFWAGHLVGAQQTARHEACNNSITKGSVFLVWENSVHLTLRQHGFALHESTYTEISLFATQWTDTGVGILSLLQWIFPTQALNPGLAHCRRILYQLSHKGSPTVQHRETLVNVIWQPGGRQCWGRRDTCTCMAESFCHHWKLSQCC